MNSIKIISEIGSNHNGNIDLAKKMIEVSAECGADAVKFQTFKTDELVSRHARMATYQKDALGKEESQMTMLRRLELSEDDFRELFEFCEKLQIEIFSTPFDIRSADFLASLGMKIWKIPSGEITNLPYLEHIAAISVPDKHVILSTGMASLDEVCSAVSLLENRCERMTILQCNTNYPAHDEDLNLLGILKMQELFPQHSIGLSDHSEGITAALTAVPLGITMVEKHFTLSRLLPGPDHSMSMDPDSFRALCHEIRRAEKMLGVRNKVVTQSEAPNRIWARKSIVARCAIRAGETFTLDNLTTKRPGNGISPMHWYDVLGKPAERDFEEDEMITHAGLKWTGLNM